MINFEDKDLYSNYFDNIITILKLEKSERKKYGLIIVAHILEDADFFLAALEKIFKIYVVFAKPKSINDKIYSSLKEKYTIVIADRSEINNVKYLKSFIPENSNGFLVLDIGGYFSKVSKDLKAVFRDRFLGVVEDTENGFLRYLSSGINFPFYQVARSELKKNEDYLVGQAITFSAESIFREQGILLNGQRVGVIGFGKVGSGVASALKTRQSIVSIYDIDPIKITHAYSHGYIPTSKNLLLRNSDILCLATGNKSLTKGDIKKIKKGCYIFTVTSADDELDLHTITENYRSLVISKYITLYTSTKNFFYVINNGNAVNFIHGTTVSSFILLVQAEIIFCCIALIRRNNEIEYAVENSIKKVIAKEWIKLFASKYEKSI